MTLEADEQFRKVRAQVAMMLHLRPQDVDTMPMQDIDDVIAVFNADQRVRETKRHGRGGK